MKQWEGVESNGLPTPVFNFLKRVTLFQVASITTDNIKMQASPLSGSAETSHASGIVNREFEKLFEHNKIGILLREYMRNAAVDGDGCFYTYWDAEAETGQEAKGAIVTEIVENTRVFFGNPRDRRVQRQPYIMISSRESVDEVKRRAKKNGSPDWEEISGDSDQRDTRNGITQDDRVTTVLKFWKEEGRVWAYEFTQNAEVREKWDTGLSLYPITWLNWDYIQDCYHGQAMITGLIPNQIFINKLFAMSMISLMTTAYPKIIYDKTRVSKWDSRVGAAIPIRGGDVNNVAKIMDPAQISPQISQFIELAVNYTQTFLGATSAAMGDTRPDNTSAIIALQRAASVPTEITKQNLYQSIEDLGRIYIDFMGEYYGTRVVGEVEEEIPSPIPGMPPRTFMVPETFEFGSLQKIPMHLKLDVGASAYWSEIASMQTIDNLLMQGKLELVDYLERVPDGYISKKQELINKIKQQQEQAQMMQMQQMGMPDMGNPATATPGRTGISTGGSAATRLNINDMPVGGGGYGQLQRALNQTGSSLTD